MSDKILFVDDEMNVLNAYERNFKSNFQVVTAYGGSMALDIVEKAENESDPFAVIVSDFRMPQMDGRQFLSQAKSIAPDTVRIMLTGYAEVGLAINTVNEGHIFRFLTKPCSFNKLLSNLNESVRQYRLIVSEKELLNKTLKGTVKILMDILSISNPIAFSRAAKIRTIAQKLSVNLPPDTKWQIEIAALLSQIGCVAVPTEILEKKSNGQTLSSKEKEIYLSHAQIGRSLLSNIPRLEEIAEAIGFQFKRISDLREITSDKKYERIAAIARILKHANDLNTLIEAKKPDTMTLSGFQTKYESDFEDSLEENLEMEADDFASNYILQSLMLFNLEPGMILDEDILDRNGLILVGRGIELSSAMLLRLMSFAKYNRIKEPLKVYVPVKQMK